MNNSMVIKLQKDCNNSNIQITDLLREAFTVARKLKIKKFEEWVKSEMEGYKSNNIPSYRKVIGKVQAQHPFRGIIPVIIENQKIEDAITKVSLNQSISEIESLYSQGNQILQFPLPWNIIKQLFPDSEMGVIPFVRLQHSNLKTIIDAVRNIVLDWALKLEDDGILGNDYIFNEKELKKADSLVNNGTIIYGNQIGNLNSQSGQNNQVSGNSIINYNEIEKFIELLKENVDKLDEQTSSDEIKNEIEKLQRSIENKDESNIKKSLKSIKAILEGIAGSLIASGLLYSLPKLFS